MAFIPFISPSFDSSSLLFQSQVKIRLQTILIAWVHSRLMHQSGIRTQLGEFAYYFIGFAFFPYFEITFLVATKDPIQPKHKSSHKRTQTPRIDQNMFLSHVWRKKIDPFQTKVPRGSTLKEAHQLGRGNVKLQLQRYVQTLITHLADV